MDGFLLIVVIYVVLTILGSVQKKQRQERERLQREARARAAAGDAAGPSAPVEQLGGLERALEALRRAELEAKARAADAQRRRLPQPAEVEFGYDAEASEDTEDSEEEIHDVEAINLDDESVAEAAGRQAALERFRAPLESVVEDVGPRSAIVPRIAAAIEPTIPAAEAVPAVKPAAQTRRVARGNPLARFAKGRARDAVVLGEILGRPVGERG